MSIVKHYAFKMHLKQLQSNYVQPQSDPRFSNWFWPITGLWISSQWAIDCNWYGLSTNEKYTYVLVEGIRYQLLKASSPASLMTFFVFRQVTFEKITQSTTSPDLSKNNVVSLKISKTIVLEMDPNGLLWPTPNRHKFMPKMYGSYILNILIYIILVQPQSTKLKAC